jgi:hypothetical protein
MEALDRGEVTNAADAARVADAYRLTPPVLLKEDSRVRTTFRNLILVGEAA